MQFLGFGVKGGVTIGLGRLTQRRDYKRHRGRHNDRSVLLPVLETGMIRVQGSNPPSQLPNLVVSIGAEATHRTEHEYPSGTGMAVVVE
jgi:hypothetical protein